MIDNRQPCDLVIINGQITVDAHQLTSTNEDELVAAAHQAFLAFQ